MQRCLEAGLVEGRNLAVDGTLVGANASLTKATKRIGGSLIEWQKKQTAGCSRWKDAKSV